MRTRIKICGITRAADARAAVADGADALGFVMWKGSPRQITPAAAARIIRDLPPMVACVGVFVDASPAAVRRAVQVAGFDAVQLHGDEDATVYLNCGAAVIKAVTLGGRADVARARRIPASVTLLVDAKDDVRRGGTGRAANWKLARTLSKRRSILLAGGIGPVNIADAIRVVRPWGVDLSSGVETRPGIKSARKLARLFKAAARADRKRH